MKRFLFLCAALGFILSACLPALSQPSANPTPISEADLQLTAAVLSQQTLQALPTKTAQPSATVIAFTPSVTPTQPTPTETGIPALQTLTATLLAGTSISGTQTATTGTPPTSAPGTASPTTVSSTSDGSPVPLFFGTLPPDLPYGTIGFFNKAHVEVYVSLRCVTKDGYVTILEYPVKKNFNASAPAGKYTYVAWVGGRQFDGSFSLDKDGFITISFYTNRINIKKD